MTNDFVIYIFFFFFLLLIFFFFFFNDTATTEIYTLSLHDALPIFVPATWTDGKRRSGCPNTPNSPSVGPRLHLMRLPCRAKRNWQASSNDNRLSRPPPPVGGRPCGGATGPWCPGARCAARPRPPSRARAGIRPSEI